MGLFRYSLTAIILASMVSVSFADTVDDAIKIIESGEYEKGRLILLHEANSGSAKAQDELGAYYQFYKEDYEEAFEWYKKSAEQGYADAQYNVGAAYDYGEGVKQDYQKAIKWYRMAVDQNYSHAQFNLAQCYLEGTGVKVNYREAAQLMMKAANQKHVGAQNNLAALYYQGKGIEKSPEKAIAWLTVASIGGSEMAQRNLEKILSYYDDETIERAKQIAQTILSSHGN